MTPMMMRTATAAPTAMPIVLISTTDINHSLIDTVSIVHQFAIISIVNVKDINGYVSILK